MNSEPTIPAAQSKLLTAPNLVTALRLLLLPLIVPFLLHGAPFFLLSAFVLLCFAELSDITDGYIARDRGEVSKIGKLLDPLADSITRVVIFMTFLAMDLIPFWMVLVFFLRDISIAYYRAFAASEGFVMGARLSGKVKGALQSVASLVPVLLLVIASQKEFLATAESKQLYLWIIGGGSVAYWSYCFYFRFRGGMLVLTGGLFLLGLAPLLVMYWYTVPDFDEMAWIYWLVLGAAVYTAYSLVDYTIGFVQAMGWDE
ncbi:MAG: CDP-alcohol phosphatidyltransferase family protein [Myxococcota bacterium]|nr:CDP-alcohol phosphatidyltransferase family protein [Myxococcota bacterium]